MVQVFCLTTFLVCFLFTITRTSCLYISSAINSSQLEAHENQTLFKEQTSLNLNDSVHQDQICPSLGTNDLGTYTALTELYPLSVITVTLPKVQDPRRNHDDFPCNFKIRGAGQVTNVGIRAIYRTSVPWNFFKSSTCDSFIKFRVPESGSEGDRGEDPQIICRIWKVSLGHKNPNLVHPILWHVADDVVISFPPRGNVTESKGKPTYLQIVFTVSSGVSCSMKVQQYLVDENNDGCNATIIPQGFQSCGSYRCSDNIHTMNQLGYWTYVNWGSQSEFEPPRAPVLRSRFYENGYVRRRTYWFTALVRSSVVPILFFGMILLGYKFFCVLYPSYPVLAERRARIAQNRSVIQTFNEMPIDSSNVRHWLSHGHVPYGAQDYETQDDIQLPRSRPGESNNRVDTATMTQAEDPPPAYESLSPPTYSEATKV